MESVSIEKMKKTLKVRNFYANGSICHGVSIKCFIFGESIFFKFKITKMKKTILFLLILTVALLSCKKEKLPRVENNGKIILKNNLTVDDLKSFLPKVYFDESSKLIYKDKFNNEKSFSVSSFEWDKNPFETNTIKYTYDAFQIELTPDDDSNYILKISGSGCYNKQENIQSNNLDYMLIKKGDIFGDGLIFEFRDGKYYSDGFTETTSPFTIENKTYPIAYHSNYNVKSFSPTDIPFSDIIVTSEDGIIAFNDLDGKRWVFSRIE